MCLGCKAGRRQQNAEKVVNQRQYLPADGRPLGRDRLVQLFLQPQGDAEPAEAQHSDIRGIVPVGGDAEASWTSSTMQNNLVGGTNDALCPFHQSLRLKDNQLLPYAAVV